MASTYLTRTIGSGSAGKTFTISFWLKISSTSANHTIVGLSSDSNSTKYVEVALKSNHKLDIQFRNGTSGDNGTYLRRRTNRLFRDVNAWYHIVVRVDSTQGSASDRFRLYINGVQETSIDVDSTADMPQNYVTDLNNNGSTFRIGRGAGSSSYYLDGSLSHFHFADGQSLAPTVFGETDSTTGEWKIITSPSFTVGTEGFTILKDGNTITDQSSNSNDFTLGAGTLTKTEDNPSNVFATLNPLFQSAGNDLNRGNTQSTNNTSNWYWRPSTLAATSGKYYCEVRISAVGASIVGIADLDDCVGYAPVDTHFGKTAVSPNGRGFAWYSDDGKIYYNNTSSSVFGTYTTSDILSLAMDIDNGAFYIGKNGTWLNSGDPTSGSSKTGAVSTWTGGGTWTFANAVASNSVEQFNYGNGIFGQSTAVSSAGTNASGNGIFEYDVPTGYTALSTKGLNL